MDDAAILERGQRAGIDRQLGVGLEGFGLRPGQAAVGGAAEALVLVIGLAVDDDDRPLRGDADGGMDMPADAAADAHGLGYVAGRGRRGEEEAARTSAG